LNHVGDPLLSLGAAARPSLPEAFSHQMRGVNLLQNPFRQPNRVRNEHLGPWAEVRGD
jgi:hypothetical protein